MTVFRRQVAVLEPLLTAIRALSVGAPQHNDVTALVLRYRARAGPARKSARGPKISQNAQSIVVTIAMASGNQKAMSARKA